MLEQHATRQGYSLRVTIDALTRLIWIRYYSFYERKTYGYMRSPNYPAIGLTEAVELAQRLWDREKRSFTPNSIAVQAWGYAGLSGASRVKLASLKRYGLLEENANGDIRLSGLAMEIIHNPTESAERLSGLRTAGLSPDLFKELHESHGSASDESIRAYLITKKGFSDVGANACIEAFRDTQNFARLGDVEQDVTNMTAATSTTAPTGKSVGAPPVLSGPPLTHHAGKDLLYRWPLSKDVVAELRLTGSAKPLHLKLVKQYIDVAMVAMEMDADEGDNQDHPVAES